MDKIKVAKELTQIAKSLIGTTKKASIVHVNTKDGIVEENVTSVTIIVKALESSKRLVASPKKHVHDYRDKPIYPIQEIKECLSKNPPSIQFEDSPGNLSCPKESELSRKDVVDILKNLNPKKYRAGGNYVKSHCLKEPYADEYRAVVNSWNKRFVEYYIKLWVKEHKMVVVISFHESGLVG